METSIEHELVSAKELSRLHPTISSAYIALVWGSIVTAAVVCVYAAHPVVYFVAIAFIGARQHDLGTMIHEAVHFRLAKSRRVNDWIGEVLTWPFLILDLRAYRANHLAHHQNLNTDDDPDWVLKQNDEWRFPMTRTRLALLLSKDLLGVGLVNTVLRARKFPRPESAATPELRRMRIARALVTGFAVAIVIASGLTAEVFLLWVVPFATWLQVCMRLRSIAEHFALDPSTPDRDTRSVSLTLFDRIFFLSNATSLHGEHHLYPGVPFYRLRALRSELEHCDDFRRTVEMTRGYHGVLRDCVSR